MTRLQRYTILDSLRGFSVLSMILYHATWDLVYIFRVYLPFFQSDAASLWQKSIRFTFLLLSGFCWSLSRRNLKRGVFVFLCSVVISLVTAVFMPSSAILFGVLSLIGTAMVVTVPLDKLFRKLSPYIGFLGSFLLFALTRYVSVGRLSLFGHTLWRLPEVLYANLFTAYLGFPTSGFHSSDYVPVIPWLFLYWMGYFLYQIAKKHDLLKYLSAFRIPPLEWIGRHSLIIYMLHQPVVYGVLYVIFTWILP